MLGRGLVALLVLVPVGAAVGGPLSFDFVGEGTLLLASEAGLARTLPRPSPEGTFLVEASGWISPAAAAAPGGSEWRGEGRATFVARGASVTIPVEAWLAKRAPEIVEFAVWREGDPSEWFIASGEGRLAGSRGDLVVSVGAPDPYGRDDHAYRQGLGTGTLELS